MATIGPTQSAVYYDIPIFNSQFPKEGSKAVPASLDFSAQQSYSLDFSLLQQRGYMKTWQSVFIDNSLNAAPLSISVNGSQQLLKCPGNSQAVLPIFVPGLAQFVISCTGGQRALVVFMNVPSFTAVWGASGNLSFDVNGNLLVSDTALDALIQSGALNVLQNGTANANTVKPIFYADELFTGSTTTTTAQTVVTGAPSFFITDVHVYISGGAEIAAGGFVNVTLKDDATIIAQGTAYLGTAAPTADQGPFELIRLEGIQYNSKGSAKNLTLTMDTVLTAGKMYWNIAGGVCSNIGP